MTELVGLTAADALLRLTDGAVRVGHTLVLDRADGTRFEAQIGLGGRVESTRVFPAVEVVEHGAAGRRYQVPDAVAVALRKHAGGAKGSAAEARAQILTAGGVRAVPLWTRLQPDGGQLQAWTLLEGGLVVIRVAVDGRLAGVGMSNGLLGYLALDREDRTRERLPERHENPHPARTLGEAMAHARAAGSAVLTLRRDAKGGPRVALVCAAPAARDGRWFPHFAGAGQVDGVATERHTRSYLLADPDSVDPADLGRGGTPLLTPTQLSVLGGILVHPGRPTAPSALDRRVARAAFAELLARVPDGATTLPADAFSSRLAPLRKRKRPDHFTRVGLQALVASLAPVQTVPTPSEQDARWWLRLKAWPEELAHVDGARWTLPRPGGGTWTVQLPVTPGARLLDAGHLHDLSLLLLRGLPVRTDLLTRGLLEHVLAQLDQAAQTRTRLRVLLGDGPAIPAAQRGRPELPEALFTRESMDRFDAVLDGVVQTFREALAQTEPLPTEGPDPLSADARRAVLQELVPGRPLVEALQAAANGALIAIAPIAQFSAGEDRMHRFFAVTGTGAPITTAVLAAVTGAEDAVLGRVLLEGPAAQAQLDVLAPLVATPDRAREAALVGAAALEASLAAQLREGMADPQALARSLRPRPGDAHKVFRSDVADAVEAAQTRSWDKGAVRIKAQSNQTDIQVSVAPAGMLGQSGPLSRPFPRAYQALSDYLEPSRVWATWVHRAPGKKTGMRYDGLVWVDDHWAWFPKPWRALKGR